MDEQLIGVFGQEQQEEQSKSDKHMCEPVLRTVYEKSDVC